VRGAWYSIAVFSSVSYVSYNNVQAPFGVNIVNTLSLRTGHVFFCLVHLVILGLS